MQARRFVEAPASRPLPFGLLSAASVVPDNDAHLGLGVQYQTLACGTAHLTQDECVSGVTQPDPWLTDDDGYQLVVGDAFTVYALHVCNPVGGNMGQGAEAAKARLANGLGRAVEEALEAVALPAADDLTPTPGTPVHPIAGLAILEEYASRHYNGVPVLHVNRGTGTLLGQNGGLHREGTRLETVQGTVVASGGGYGLYTGPVGGVTADATGRWMRISGAVVVRHGTPQSYGAHLRRGAGNLPVNSYAAYAQQPVVATIECINAAVLVQAPSVFYTPPGTDGGTP